MDRPNTTSFTRRYLPHWRVADRPYFVTFRLAATIPRVLFQEVETQRTMLRRADDDASRNLHRLMLEKLESHLDAPNPARDWLRKPQIARVVADSFAFAESEWHWRIPAYVIMPNHVHALLGGGDTATRDLSATLGSIKKFTARKANRILARKGRFWQPESFDHWCRTVDEEASVIDYIRNNPVKAGLVQSWRDWPWIK